MWESVGLLAARGGPTGLLVLVVLSLVQGWLVPRRTHLDRIADKDAVIAALEATLREREMQINTLLSRRLGSSE